MSVEALVICLLLFYSHSRGKVVACIVLAHKHAARNAHTYVDRHNAQSILHNLYVSYEYICEFHPHNEQALSRMQLD